MRKAIIKDKKVVNVIETGENGVCGVSAPLDCVLWDCTQYAVIIGDTFIDGKFYRENELVEYIPSTEEKLAMLESKTESNTTDFAEALINIQYEQETAKLNIQEG